MKTPIVIQREIENTLKKFAVDQFLSPNIKGASIPLMAIPSFNSGIKLEKKLYPKSADIITETTNKIKDVIFAFFIKYFPFNLDVIKHNSHIR